MIETKKMGIVIKILDIDDYDQVVTILTSNEVFSIIALGVRKMSSKNRVALQLGNIVEVEIFQARLKGKLSKLKRANLLQQPPIKKSDTAMILLGLIQYLGKVQNPTPDLIKGIIESFKFFGGRYNHHVRTYVFFRILATVGIGPSMGSCIECGKKTRINGFEFYKGGFTCVLHTNKTRDISFLKTIESLTGTIDDYIKVSDSINAIVFEEMISFWKNNMY